MATADESLPVTGKARIINNRNWLDNISRIPISAPTRPGATVPMDIDSTGGRFLGLKPMQIDSTGTGGQYLGTKPMQGVETPRYKCRNPRCTRRFNHKDELNHHYNRHPLHK